MVPSRDPDRPPADQIPDLIEHAPLEQVPSLARIAFSARSDFGLHNEVFLAIHARGPGAFAHFQPHHYEDLLRDSPHERSLAWLRHIPATAQDPAFAEAFVHRAGIPKARLTMSLDVPDVLHRARGETLQILLRGLAGTYPSEVREGIARRVADASSPADLVACCDELLRHYEAVPSLDPADLAEALRAREPEDLGALPRSLVRRFLASPSAPLRACGMSLLPALPPDGEHAPGALDP